MDNKAVQCCKYGEEAVEMCTSLILSCFSSKMVVVVLDMNSCY